MHPTYATAADAIRASAITTDISHTHGIGAGLEVVATFKVTSTWVEWDRGERDFWEHIAYLDALIIGSVVIDPSLADRLFYEGFRKQIEETAAEDFAELHDAAA